MKPIVKKSIAGKTVTVGYDGQNMARLSSQKAKGVQNIIVSEILDQIKEAADSGSYQLEIDLTPVETANLKKELRSQGRYSAIQSIKGQSNKYKTIIYWGQRKDDRKGELTQKEWMNKYSASMYKVIVGTNNLKRD